MVADSMTADSRPVAVVTGSSRGIGRAIAVELGRTHHVVLGGRDPEPLRALAGELPSASIWAADLADTHRLGGFLDDLERLDVVVHSAGVIGGGAVLDTSPEEWRRVFDINLFAVAEITRLALPRLRASHGTIVFINSGSGFSAAPRGSVYAASKFALRAFADGLREEERPHGVRVSSVHPGRTATDMQRELVASESGTYDEAYYLAPRDVADTVRLVVDLPPSAVVESLSVRPLRKP